MDVYISVDMEGIAGIAHPEQVTPGTNEFERCRVLMTREASAAVAGAFDGGATRVVVNDSHASMFNLLPEELDPRAELIIGSPKVPQSMMTGLSPGYAVALFVGYHAPPGTVAAVLDHTYTGLNFYDVRLNGESMSEAELNALLAGVSGVPLGLVTGDDKICEHVAARIPGVRTVAVKQSLGRQVASSWHPERARAAIREAAQAVVADAGGLAPFTVDPPYEIEVDGRNSLGAELMALVPGSVRTGGRTVRFTTPDYTEAFRCLLAWMYLTASVPR